MNKGESEEGGGVRIQGHPVSSPFDLPQIRLPSYTNCIGCVRQTERPDPALCLEPNGLKSPAPPQKLTNPDKRTNSLVKSTE